MLVLCHLFLGLLLGVITGYLLSDRSAVIFVMIGSVLPDIIDKPLGHIFLAESIGDGRIFCHSIFIVVFFASVALLVWKKCGSKLLFYITLGVLFHQLMDAMWIVPVHWYWPVLGPYPLNAGYGEGYFTSQFLREITSVSEWLFFMILFVLSTAFCLELRDRGGFLLFKKIKWVLSSLLFIMGISSLWLGIKGEWDYSLAYLLPESMLILAMVSFAGFLSIMIFGDKLFLFVANSMCRDYQLFPS